jgi:hypothetical protein
VIHMLVLEALSRKEAEDILRKLGVDPSKEDLNKVRRRLAIKYHPDKPGGNAKVMYDVNAAVDTLLKLGPSRTSSEFSWEDNVRATGYKPPKARKQPFQDRKTVAQPSDDFFYSYCETALWSSAVDDGGDSFSDKGYDIQDISNSAQRRMKADCIKFQRDNKEDLATVYAAWESTHKRDPERLAGHLFWLNRNGHGTGFWDEAYDFDEQEVKDAFGRLDKACDHWGECYLFLDDSGEIDIE